MKPTIVILYFAILATLFAGLILSFKMHSVDKDQPYHKPISVPHIDIGVPEQPSPLQVAKNICIPLARDKHTGKVTATITGDEAWQIDDNNVQLKGNIHFYSDKDECYCTECKYDKIRNRVYDIKHLILYRY